MIDIVFAVLGVGMPWLMLFAEWRGIHTGDQRWPGAGPRRWPCCSASGRCPAEPGAGTVDSVIVAAVSLAVYFWGVSAGTTYLRAHPALT
jgi:hypothetical protein